MAEEREVAIATGSLKTSNSEGINRSVGRLSSLPNDILIGIISLLPLRLAMATGSLSRRWRGLWTNTTSIDITPLDSRELCKLDSNNLFIIDTAMNEIMEQITSPVIDSFRLDVGRYYAFWVPLLDTLIRRICDRNIHQLKVRWPCTCCDFYTLPSVIFQTQSLVSLELNSTYGHFLELPRDFENINLPNLKNLNLSQFVSSRLQWIENLIKACPSLEELSLYFDSNPSQSFKCSNQNLRRLLLKTDFVEINTVVIKAPKLEYLAISAPKSGFFSFEQEPIVLCEAKIKFNYEADALFFGAISNVRFLTLDISNPKLDNLSTVFRNATRLTLDMNVTRNLKTLLSILEMYPVLDVLTLNVMDIGKDKEQSCPQPVSVSPLRRALKRINVNIYNWGYTYCEPAKSFLDIVVYLLRNTLNLEQFNLGVQGCHNCLASNMERKEARELKLCELLYQCPMVSKGCDVEFKGRYLKMSRKDGPKAWLPDGTYLSIYSSTLVI